MIGIENISATALLEHSTCATLDSLDFVGENFSPLLGHTNELGGLNL
jgi:hypothetical protein